MNERSIGTRLLHDGAVTSDQLDAAISRQRSEGGLLGRQLVLSGALTRRELYEALAAQWDLPLVDLVASPPTPGLITADDLPAAEAGWIPWHDEDGTVTVATSTTPTRGVLAAARQRFGPDVRFVATTDWDITQAVQRELGAELAYDAAERFANERPDLSAKPGMLRWQYTALFVVALVTIAGLLLDLHTAALVLFIAANVVFSVQVLLKVITALMSFGSRREPHDGERVPDDDLPVYTILIPAFGEANVVDQVIANIGALDYPASKLDVLLLLETEDTETIQAAKAARPPEYVRIVVVPPGHPQTKPRACNYGLALARGSFVVIFDAEDRPEPGQLRRAVDAFRADEHDRAAGSGHERPLACVQAALNYFNADYDVLTRLFAVEYAHWFDAMLPGMDRVGIPIPLGGTSNHFDLTALVQAGGWDPYNVTEDADLGLRIDAAGYRVATIDSVTWEEATPRLRPWIRQRTRWIKGYIMTAAVNLRRPLTWRRHAGMREVATMVGLILGTPLAFLAYPLTLALTVLTLLGLPTPLGELDHWLWAAGTANFIVSTAALILVSAIAAWRRYSWRIAVFALANPLYWLGHAVAAWRALWQILTSPHHWEKTPHGLTEQCEDSTVDSHV